MGMILANFQSLGNVDADNDKLNSEVIDGAITDVQSLSNFSGIPSKLMALVVFNVRRWL
jgi:hypothetical protein